MTGDRVLAPQVGPQEDALASSADVLLHGGGRGGAKSYTMLLRALRWVHVPGYGAYLFREHESDLTAGGGLVEKAHEIYPHAGGRWSESDLQWTFPSGATIEMCAFGGSARGMSRWLGQQLCFIGIDEAAPWREAWFSLLMSSNRSTCGVRPRMHLTCNPDPDSFLLPLILDRWIAPVGHPLAGYPLPDRAGRLYWFARVRGEMVWGETRRELLARYPDCSPLSFEFHPALLQDNPALLRTDRTYAAKLASLPDVERARYLNGNWFVRHSFGEVFKSSWFPAHGPAPQTAKRVRSWDLAWTEHGCWTVGILKAQAPSGWYVEDMIAFRATPDKVKRTITETAQVDGRETIVRLPADGAASWEIDRLVVALTPLVRKVHVATERGDIGERSVELRTQAERGLIRLCSTHPTRQLAQELAAEGVEVSTRTDWRPVLQAALDRFPGKPDDHVSALVGGFDALAAVAPPLDEGALAMIAEQNPLLRARAGVHGRFDAEPGRAMSAGRFRMR